MAKQHLRALARIKDPDELERVAAYATVRSKIVRERNKWESLKDCKVGDSLFAHGARNSRRWWGFALRVFKVQPRKRIIWLRIGDGTVRECKLETLVYMDIRKEHCAEAVAEILANSNK